MKTAFITGLSGQDGSYLAEFLVEKGYKVVGMVRRRSDSDLTRLQKVLPHVEIVYGDLGDISSLHTIMKKYKPDEIYNLGAQSFVGESWNQPIVTSEVTGLGALRVLEAMRAHCPKAKFYQASSSEMFGNSETETQNENTPFTPRSPYGCAKLFAHWISTNYRESYDMFCSNGLLYNHESPRRGTVFVTKKIVDAVVKIKHGELDCVYLGDLDTKRDWGHAKDYVRAMWMILQHDKPDDFVIGTGKTNSVRYFLEQAFKRSGMEIESNGKKGLLEEYTIKGTTRVVVRIDKRFMRPAELYCLKADYSKAKAILGWEPKYSFDDLIDDMLRAENGRTK